MTYKSPKTGQPVLRCYHVPRTREDLVPRRRMLQRWAEQTFGLMARTPRSDALQIPEDRPARAALLPRSANQGGPRSTAAHVATLGRADVRSDGSYPQIGCPTNPRRPASPCCAATTFREPGRTSFHGGACCNVGPSRRSV